MSRQLGTFDAVIKAPFGSLGIRITSGAVSSIELYPRSARVKAPRSAAARGAVRALEAYFRDPHAPLRIPVRVEGTPFQRRVWRALRRIPPGRWLSYGTLAARLGTSARAVGGACRANPVPIVVPCHRVVAADGTGGFMGATGGRSLGIKTWLLAHESETATSGPS